jgi:hypothetical protein
MKILRLFEDFVPVVRGRGYICLALLPHVIPKPRAVRFNGRAMTGSNVVSEGRTVRAITGIDASRGVSGCLNGFWPWARHHRKFHRSVD